MDPKFMKLLGNSLQAAKKTQACQKKKCPKELAASEKQAKAILAKTMALVDQLGKKKITLASFVKQTNKIREEALETDVSKRLMTCSLETCDGLLRDMLTASMDLLMFTCKQDKKKGCERVKDLQAILKKKELTVDDCIHFLQVLTREVV